MHKITKLSQEVIGKIAAGEVVERPAAAIKELIENSMDAGASAITIEIKDGGIAYIRVTDNGSGIPQSEIRMAFERHATSKIDKAEDLFNIHTLGFRGEALASIAAVSHVTCTTRTKNDESGVTIINQGGEITEIKEAACPEGTTFIIQDLFYNTPVRLKFLKKPAFEGGLVSDLIMRLILSRPDISFRYINQNKTMYHSPGDGKLASAVYAIYGKELLTSMREIKGAANGLSVSGYVGIGESARGNRNHQSFFINGRYMKSPLLSSALEQGTKERVTIGHFPTAVLHIAMPYDKVDVNVHPNKLEVRFQNEFLVLEGLRDLIKTKLDEDTPLSNIPAMPLSKEEAPLPTARHQITQAQQISPPASPINSKTIPNIQGQSHIQPIQPIQIAPNDEKASILNESFSESLTPPAQSAMPMPPAGKSIEINAPIDSMASKAIQEALITESFLDEIGAPPIDLNILGVVFQTYILIEYGEQLLLIDQHAAHERLLFNQMMAAFNNNTQSQRLLVSQLINLTHREQVILKEYEEALRNVGFEIESFDDNSVQLRGVPVILGQPQAKAFLLEILDELENSHGLSNIEKQRAAILQMACKRAVKGGERLPEIEISHIVSQMIEDGVTPTCPHGRPLVIAISHHELDKRFKRIQ